MTRNEYDELAAFIAAGVGQPVEATDTTTPRLALRKGYLYDVRPGVYALSERGAVHAQRIAEPSPRSRLFDRGMGPPPSGG